MTNNNIADLQNMDLGKTLIDEDLSKYTTYKVGGKAKVLVFPENKEKLLELLKYIKENNLKYFVMGNGSNLLISSKVFDGVVIKLNKLNNNIHKLMALLFFTDNSSLKILCFGLIIFFHIKI